jgi:cysteine-rich repeat protein
MSRSAVATTTGCTNAGASGPCNLFNRPCFENQITRTGEASPLGSYCTEDPAKTTCTTNADCAVGSCVPDSSEPTTVARRVPPTAIDRNAGGILTGSDHVQERDHQLPLRQRRHRGIEECDDGNNANSDGCNEICETE